MMIRRIIALLLCGVLAAGMLCGCTGEQMEIEQTRTTTEDTTAGTTVETTAPEPESLVFETQYVYRLFCGEKSSILIFRTAEELEAHTARMRENGVKMGSGPEGEGEEGVSYSNIVKAYDEDFFVTNTLILIPMSVGSSSYCVKATNVTLTDKTVLVEVDELVTAPGYAFTEMLGGWTLFVAVNAVFEDDVTVECQVTKRPVTGEFLQYLHKKIRGE